VPGWVVERVEPNGCRIGGPVYGDMGLHLGAAGLDTGDMGLHLGAAGLDNGGMGLHLGAAGYGAASWRSWAGKWGHGAAFWRSWAGSQTLPSELWGMGALDKLDKLDKSDKSYKSDKLNKSDKLDKSDKSDKLVGCYPEWMAAIPSGWLLPSMSTSEHYPPTTSRSLQVEHRTQELAPLN